MYAITKEFTFDASHVLSGLPTSHPCGRLHGHTYRVVVELKRAQLNAIGFVVDYGELGKLKQYIDQVFDHRHLNDVLGDINPTAENLAYHFYRYCKNNWPETVAVRVSETPKTWAEYRP